MYSYLKQSAFKESLQRNDGGRGKRARFRARWLEFDSCRVLAREAKVLVVVMGGRFRCQR
eukprot:4122183-Pleurochrysis_carterae.AAC.1